jgi:hypothetical protein
MFHFFLFLVQSRRYLPLFLAVSNQIIQQLHYFDIYIFGYNKNMVSIKVGSTLSNIPPPDLTKRKFLNVYVYIISLLIFLLVFIGLPVSHATTLSFPSGVKFYAPLNISNAQSTAAPANFSQMVNFTYTSDNAYINLTGKHAFQNLEFFNTSSGTVIDSWLESNTSTNVIYWIKLPNGIPSSTTLKDVAIGFASNTTNLFNNKTTGEAPQLSATYGQYDDGVNVFINYWNFAGTGVPSGWTTSGTVSIDNGVTITPSTAVGTIETTSTTYGLSNYILEFYGDLPSTTSDYQSAIGYISGTTAYDAQVAWTLLDYSVKAGSYSIETAYPQTIATNAGTRTATDSITASGTHLWQIYWPSTSDYTFSYDYGTIATLTVGPTATMSIGIIGEQGTASPPIGPIYYFRTRAYPPSGVMPSVTFGAVATVPTNIILYLNGVEDANATITYGTQSNFTATINNGQFISLYVNGTKVAGLSKGTATYLANLSAGLYKVIASTNTSVVANKTYYETINKATPTISFTTSPNVNYTYNGTGVTWTLSVTSINSQVSGTLSVNNVAESSPYTSTAAAGAYIGWFNTTSNQNYTATETKLARAISRAVPSFKLLVPFNFTFDGQIPTINFGVFSVNNQLTSYLYVTNTLTDATTLVDTTNSSSSYNLSRNAGVYLLMYSIQGNQNYTSSAFPYGFQIYKARPSLFLFWSNTSNYSAIHNAFYANISTINSQLLGNLYINGKYVGSTHSKLDYSISKPGSYQITFNTTGNSNYENASVSRYKQIPLQKYVKILNINVSTFNHSSFKLPVNMTITNNGSVQLHIGKLVPSFNVTIPIINVTPISKIQLLSEKTQINKTVNLTNLLNYSCFGNSLDNVTDYINLSSDLNASSLGNAIYTFGLNSYEVIPIGIHNISFYVCSKTLRNWEQAPTFLLDPANNVYTYRTVLPFSSAVYAIAQGKTVNVTNPGNITVQYFFSAGLPDNYSYSVIFDNTTEYGHSPLPIAVYTYPGYYTAVFSNLTNSSAIDGNLCTTTYSPSNIPAGKEVELYAGILVTISYTNSTACISTVKPAQTNENGIMLYSIVFIILIVLLTVVAVHIKRKQRRKIGLKDKRNKIREKSGHRTGRRR